ncbi:MAG: cytochrome P450 [Chloroflexota bacterium]
MNKNLNELGMFQNVEGEYEAYHARRAEISKCPMSGMAAEFKPSSANYLQNPYKFFEKARPTEPVFYSPEEDCWLVMGYKNIIEVFKDPITFSVANARHPVQPLCPAAAAERDRLNISIEPSLVDEGPETHRKHRRIFGDAFTIRRVNRIEDQVRAIVTRYIDAFIEEGKADLVSQLLYEVPALAIFIFIGAKDEDAVFVKKLGGDRALVNFGWPTEKAQVKMMQNMAEHWEFTKKLVSDALDNPGDNYLGDMVRLHQEDPSSFTINYLTNVMFVMQFAGHETTTQASANGIKAMLEDRAVWEKLCANPELIPNAVEEILRIDTSIFGWRRITTKDTRIGDKEIPAGSKILMMLGSGNHDEAMFPNPTKFDPERPNAKKHLGLGYGSHFCMGAPLARLEMRIILEELTRRLPHMHLVKGQPYEYLPTLLFRGVQHLQVEWDAAQNQNRKEKTTN